MCCGALQGRRQDFHGGVSEGACAKRARKKFQATPILTIPSHYSDDLLADFQRKRSKNNRNLQFYGS